MPFEKAWLYCPLELRKQREALSRKYVQGAHSFTGRTTEGVGAEKTDSLSRKQRQLPAALSYIRINTNREKMQEFNLIWG